MARERAGRLPLYANARKMKSLTLCTNSLMDLSSSRGLARLSNNYSTFTWFGFVVGRCGHIDLHCYRRHYL